MKGGFLMVLASFYPYSKSAGYESSTGLIVDKIKKVLYIQCSSEYHDKVTKFYNQLLLLSKYWGLGDSISVETVHEEFTPEYIFTIQIPKNLSKKEKNDIFMKLNFQMEHYCKSNNMFNFFKDAHIIFE